MALVAVTVTEVVLVTLGGEKAPLLEIVPTLADQVTDVLAVPVMLAVKCCCPLDGMVARLGEIAIVTLGLLSETTIRKEVEPFRGEVETDRCSFCGGSDTTSTES
jgi:hypothetical protein